MDATVSPHLNLPFEVIPTNLPGVFSSVAPLVDFDPRTASDRDLIKRGLLLRRAGGVLPGTWTRAVGYWQIPAFWMLAEPQGSQGGWNASSWAGIDGAFGSDDVRQAGAEHKADASGTRFCVASWHSESRGQM